MVDNKIDIIRIMPNCLKTLASGKDRDCMWGWGGGGGGGGGGVGGVGGWRCIKRFVVLYFYIIYGLPFCLSDFSV